MKNPDSSTNIWDTTQVYVLAIEQSRKPVTSQLLISLDADGVVSLELIVDATHRYPENVDHITGYTSRRNETH